MDCARLCCFPLSGPNSVSGRLGADTGVEGILVARKVVLVDDIDGNDADETVSFGLDGTSYEIDLSSDNAAALRDALAEYVDHARKVVDELHDHVPRAPVDGQARSLGAAADLLAQPVVPTGARDAALARHLGSSALPGVGGNRLGHAHLPVFPTLRRMTSPA